MVGRANCNTVPFPILFPHSSSHPHTHAQEVMAHPHTHSGATDRYTTAATAATAATEIQAHEHTATATHEHAAATAATATHEHTAATAGHATPHPDVSAAHAEFLVLIPVFFRLDSNRQKSTPNIRAKIENFQAPLSF